MKRVSCGVAADRDASKLPQFENIASISEKSTPKCTVQVRNGCWDQGSERSGCPGQSSPTPDHRSLTTDHRLPISVFGQLLSHLSQSRKCFGIYGFRCDSCRDTEVKGRSLAIRRHSLFKQPEGSSCSTL